MILTVAFDVKNHVEVMEGWPIRAGATTFHLKREGDVLRSVSISFTNVPVDDAPRFTQSDDDNTHSSLEMRGSRYVEQARSLIMNWQAIISGIQIVDIDYDKYELVFHPENIDEESRIHVKSFKPNSGKVTHAACDFEQMGRAFCAGPVTDDRIESTSHYREGRIAFEAKRYVDSYNNMFLFLETRYCDGKTKTAQQTQLLKSSEEFCRSLERSRNDFEFDGETADGVLKLTDDYDLEERIKSLVMLRGALRHHSLKSPHRWDPNRQDKYEQAARFLSLVVHDIVGKESIDEIYSPSALEAFRERSVSSGNETKIKLITYRLNKEPSLFLSMSYPTTVVSSNTCIVNLRHAMEQCAIHGQLGDTVRLESRHEKRDLLIFELVMDVWAYTKSRSILLDAPARYIRCDFERIRSGLISKHSFSIPWDRNEISISDVWRLIEVSLNHIEGKDPTTRIMGMTLSLGDGRKAITSYRLGAMVRN